MPIATFKDLCVDVVDPGVMGLFWAETLGLEPKPLDDGDGLLTGPTPQHGVWLNTVPEPVTVKQRVHLDVRAATTEEVLARGATPLDVGRLKWDVLRDPEGGELCVFPPRQGEAPSYKLLEVVVDAVDAHAITAWWAEVFGATVQDNDGEQLFSWFEDAPGMPFVLVFQQVPEPKTVKNRVHWDVETATSSSSSTVVPRCCGSRTTRCPGTCWPTPRATSSASSGPGSDRPRPRVGCRA